MRKSGYPIPAYIPPPVREFIEHKRKENPQYGVSHIAEDAGTSAMGAVKFFRDDKHKGLFTFQKFCTSLGTTKHPVTMDDVAKYLTLDKVARRSKLEALIRERYATDSDLATAIGVSDKYIERMLDGSGGKKILKTYAPYAGAIGVNLEQLATILGDVR